VKAPYRLAPLEANDIDSYRQLRLEALRDAPTAFGSSYETEAGLRASHYRERLTRSPENHVLGAWSGGTLIGMAGFFREVTPKRRHIGSIWGMYVTPAARGQGLGRQLLVRIVDRARKIEGLEHILLTVVSDNEVARRLYESVGFETWGIEPAGLKVDGIDYDEIHMLLDLRQATVVTDPY